MVQPDGDHPPVAHVQLHAPVAEAHAVKRLHGQHDPKLFQELLRILVMHSYTVDIAAADRMIAVVMVADDIVERRGIGPGEPKEIELSEGPGAKSLGLSADACAELDRRFAKAYDQAQGIFV